MTKYKELSSILFELKNKKGVYKIFDKNLNLVYVGKSYNLMSRIKVSLKNKEIGKYLSFSIIDDKYDINRFETTLIIDNNFPFYNKCVSFTKFIHEEDFLTKSFDFSELYLINNINNKGESTSK